MTHFVSIKTNKYKKLGGIIEVKIRDEFYNKIYENEVGLNDKDGIKKLITDLKAKGVDNIFKESDWF